MQALRQTGPRWQGAFAPADPADEPAIRKFLIDTIERFSSTLSRKERGT